MKLVPLVAVVLALAGSAQPASGQDAPAAAAPYRALFGGAVDTRPERQILSLSVSAEEAYDDNLLIDTLGAAPLSQLSGWYTGLNGTVDFSSRGDRFQTRLTTGSNWRYYSHLGRADVVSYMAGAGFSARIARGLNLVVDQSVAYSPSYLYGLFASVAPPGVGNFVNPAANYDASSLQSYTYATTAQLSQSVGKRGVVSFDSHLRRTNFTNNPPGLFDFKSYDLAGRFTYRLTRFASLRLGYVHRQTEFAPLVRALERDIDAGIDYQRPLSRTRRTTIAFRAGTTSFRGPLFGALSSDIRHQYGVTADASLAHQIGRTWQLRGTYRRGLSNIEGFSGPIFTDGMSVTAAGFVNRRADLSISGAYTNGDSLLAARQSALKTYTGDVRFRYAITRMWAPYIEYLYYYYDFDRTLPLPPGVTPRLQRNSIRVGVTTWIPVWRRR